MFSTFDGAIESRTFELALQHHEVFVKIPAVLRIFIYFVATGIFIHSF